MSRERADQIVTEFLRLVSDLRRERGLTHEDLATIAGVHRTTIGLLERGERTPTLHVAGQLAAALETPLSELLQHAEFIVSGAVDESAVLETMIRRQAKRTCLRNEAALTDLTGLDGEAVLGAINSAYHTLDIIDEQLTARGSAPLSNLVELANLSSMMGNLLGSGLAEHSGGLYLRNRPHAYPDLLPQGESAVDLEIKVALENNKPKGHLPKAGTYITFRYVLCTEGGAFTHGKAMRGATPWVWEVKAGRLSEDDFAISNTAGDSGKTAVIRTEVFNAMPLIYYVPELLPYGTRRGMYPGFN